MTGQPAVAQVDLAEDWRIVRSNDAFAALVGAGSAERVEGRLLSEFVADRLLLDRLLAVLRADRQPVGADIDLTRLDGRAVSVTVILEATSGPDHTLASLRARLAEATDTGRRNVLGAQRMEAIGRLAGGIAHDFNNLLMVVSGHVERLLDELPDGDPLHGSAEAIRDATFRAASLTRQLLAFSRRQVLQVRPTLVHDFVSELRPRLEAVLRERIDLKLELAEVPRVRIDTLQLEDALISLVMNACDAMPRGGTLVIRTEIETVPDDATRRHAWIRPGSYVRVVVSDTGHGMDPVTKSRVFEPFFTTRALGHGAGLGLATVYGFVKQSHGYVFVDSEVGRGAAFTILFPIIPPHPAAGEPPRAAVFETILVVDDDESGRTRVGEALRREGYHVLEAPSGERAADVFAAWPARVHLLLLTTSGPVEPGQQLVTRFRALDPLLQVLHLVDPAATAFSAAARGPFAGQPHVVKPFSTAALVQKVREVLDTGDGR